MSFSLKQKAILALVIVAFGYSLLNVAVRLMGIGFEPFTQVYLRIGLGFILAMILLHKKIRFSNILKISRRDWIILLLMGSFGYGLAVDFVTLSILHTKLLNVAVISSTTPFFVFLFSILVLRKRFHKTLFFFLFITFYGVFILATNSFLPTLSNFAVGDFYALLFAIGLGIYIQGRKFLSAHLRDPEIAAIVMFIAFMSSLLSALLRGEVIHVASFENPAVLLGLFMGGVLNLVATNLENFGFNHLNSVTGSQLMLLENIFSPLLGFMLYHEIVSPVEFVGALVVLVGIWFYIKHAQD